MALSSGSADGIRANSAAKESDGNASTLGSQAAAAANEVIVPDAITANNEGNLETSPTYVGRMFCLRPWEMKLFSAELVAGGTNYAVNDTISLAGTVPAGGAAPLITVDAVSSGVITAFSITNPESLEIRRDGMTGDPSPTNNPVAQASSSGSGTGATFNCVWEPNFELRYITADSSNTLTVHEEWIDPPESGDRWAVSYILEDYATQTGLTLRAQSGVFEASRKLRIGPSPLTGRRGWLAINDGKQVELDNTLNDAFDCSAGGCITIGYVQAGSSVNGGYVSTSDTAPDTANFETRGLEFIHDLQIRSPRQAIQVGHNQVGKNADDAKIAREAGCIMKNIKVFDVASWDVWSDQRIEDVVVQDDPDTGPAGTAEMRTDSQVDEYMDVFGLTLVNMAEGITSDSSIRAKLGYRNVQFVGGTFITGINGYDYAIVNPIWDPDLESDSSFNLSSTSFVEGWLSLIVRPVDAQAEPIVGVRGYVFNGATRLAIPNDNENRSLSSAWDYRTLTGTEIRWKSALEIGDVAYRSDVLVDLYEGDVVIRSVRSTSLAVKLYDYGRVPSVVSAADPDELYQRRGLDQVTTMPIDSAITELVQADALTNPTTNPTIERHGFGETDPRPMKVFNYDAGTGSVPTIGETMTQDSATGVVVDYEGDAVSGTLILDTWNGTEFSDNQTITGGTSTFSATTNLLGGTGFYAEYTWEVNAQNETMAIVYDYLAARMAEDPITAAFLEVLLWGGNESGASQLLFLGADGYFTNRAVQLYKGKVDPAAVADFTDDFNRADADLDTSSNWTQFSTGAGNVPRIVSNAVTGDTTASNSAAAELEEVAVALGRRHYARVTYSTLSTTLGHEYGLTAQMDTANQRAVVLSGGRSTSTYSLRILDFSAATVTTITSTLVQHVTFPNPAANDELMLACYDGTVHAFINGVLYASISDRRLSGFDKVGIYAAGTSGALDDFEAGNFEEADVLGEGVFVHSRGAGQVDFMTADDGQVFNPATSVTLTVQVDDENGDPVQGARVRIEESPGGALIAEGSTNASGTFTAPYAYTVDQDVLTKVRLKGFKNFRTSGTITISGLTVGVRFEFDDIVDLP